VSALRQAPRGAGGLGFFRGAGPRRAAVL